MTQDDTRRVLLSHGAGGKIMTELIESVFLANYGARDITGDDSAIVNIGLDKIAFTTDSFVVDPIFFPGGDIGRLAICGTVNDLLTAAAKPLALSVSFIIEEGLDMKTLEAISASLRDAASEAGVQIVTGDTKVVPRGSADKVFITTAGVGIVLKPDVSGSSAKPGDKVILTGSLGDHGAAVMLARTNLLENESIKSDAAPLVDIVLGLIDAGCQVHAMRDPTRGGVASSLNEIARQSGVSIEIDETAIPVNPSVAAACEALGLDVLQVANEGKMIIIVAPDDADRALEIVRSRRYGEYAAIIGEVGPAPPSRVLVRTAFGTSRILDIPAGELLPRIC